MCVSQRRWMGCRGTCSPALPLVLLVLLPLSFLSSMPPYAQGSIHIPTTLLQPPILTALPTSFTAFSKDDIILPCEATGNPTPTFRWVKDGKEFGSERNGSGTLQVDENEDSLEKYAGEYLCYASNTLGTAMTQTVTVIVEPQPSLPKQQRLQRTAIEGDSITLPCNPPQSSTPPNIHWMDIRMVHVTQNERVTVGLDGHLYFSNLVKNDSRNDYICHAQYTEARTVLPATQVSLIVTDSNVLHEGKPRFFHPSSTHSSVLALRGNSLTLECIPKGLPTPKVEWKKKDGDLKKTSAQVENHNHWLKFNSIIQEDDGEYECRAFNIHGNNTRTFTVSVEAAPYWVKKPQDLMYAPGETVRLDCQAEGIPAPEVTWKINGQPITDVDEEPRRSVSDGVLILKDVEVADTAVYQCEANNVHGSILLNINLFVVELPPQILSSDGVVYKVIEGEDVALHCESFGYPRPQVAWETQDSMDPPLSNPRVSLLTNGTIKLTNVSHDDSGTYICSVMKTNISISAHLEVFNQTVILVGPQNIRTHQGTTAFLDCHFHTDPRLRENQVVWRQNHHKISESSQDDKYTVFENSTLKVTNVQLNDSGLYSCEVITDVGHMKARGSITVIAPPDAPTALSWSNAVDHSLSLSWIAGPSHNSPITEFIIEAWKKQPTEEEEESLRWEELKRVPGDFKHTQLTLYPYYIYNFRVTAVNEGGPSKPSSPSNPYTAPPAAPSSNPTGVRSNSSDPGTLIITWDELDRHYHNGPNFQYEVFWRKANGLDEKWESATAKSPPLVVEHAGTYTPFEIKVQAANSFGAGPEPEPKTGHSGEDKPQKAPTGVSCNVINSTVEVSWNQAEDVRGRILGHKIYIKRKGPQRGRSRRSLEKHPHHGEDREDRSEPGSRRHEDIRVEVVHGDTTSAKVTGLRMFSLYEIMVTVFNSKGESPQSQPHPFSTPEGAPGPPAMLRFESPTEKSLILHWTPPLEPNGILLGYRVQHQQEGDSNWKIQMIDDPNVNRIMLDNLDPNSYYTFTVTARTAVGDGSPITSRGATLLDGVPPSNVTIASGNSSLNLSWVPGERDRNHGFHIFYRKNGSNQWIKSDMVNSTQGFYILTDLQPGTLYQLKILHLNYTQWGDTVWTTGPVPSVMPSGFATQGWLIGLISAIVLLILILLILCLIKRSKGGKYAVKDKEDKEVDSEARLKDETFGEYSDGDEKRSDSQQSLGESKMGSDDSLAEYGDSVDIQFNEDGSFIGQYSGRGPAPHGNESSGPASPVNAVPPPPIAPSMSSILNRPS